MKRTNSVADALNDNAADLDIGDGLVTRIPLGDVGVTIQAVAAGAREHTETEVGKDRTRLTGLETVAIPKALADAKTYADLEVTKDRARLAQAEAADLKQNADIRETLRAALAYADAKAADISKAIDTSHVALDTDGTPYFRPGSTTVKVQQDADGTPFYEAA